MGWLLFPRRSKALFWRYNPSSPKNYSGCDWPQHHNVGTAELIAQGQNVDVSACAQMHLMMVTLTESEVWGLCVDFLRPIGTKNFKKCPAGTLV